MGQSINNPAVPYSLPYPVRPPILPSTEAGIPAPLRPMPVNLIHASIPKLTYRLLLFVVGCFCVRCRHECRLTKWPIGAGAPPIGREVVKVDGRFQLIDFAAFCFSPGAFRAR
ncbi:hypothetical protein GWI33_015571 [Rhynchophorus ferrugineus]|uniref:Uncharacterized protein n=1 Tax=Rhynchophorus ferrugineus TaxID=354439 RepID=A0A834ID14_RHYFE|nr:hypothetical protein GWI33_015571 [Rhynchophorus ferrugineus]